MRAVHANIIPSIRTGNGMHNFRPINLEDTVPSSIFAAARSPARHFWSQKSILTGARRAAAGPDRRLALVHALAARDQARARSQLRAGPCRMATGTISG